MPKSDTISLVTVTRTQNAFGGWVETVTPRQVICRVESISRAEFFEAAKLGLKPEYRFVVFFADYDGETECEYSGKLYSIYRVYHRDTDYIELYAEAKVGVTDGKG